MGTVENPNKRTGTGVGPNDTFEEEAGQSSPGKHRYTPSEARKAAAERWKRKDPAPSEEKTGPEKHSEH
jgi:hypothetical protein